MRAVKFYFLLLFVFVYSSKSSTLYNNGAKIIIETGGYLIIKGNYQAEVNAGIQLNGVISIAQDFINNISSGDGFDAIDNDGLIIFNGSGEQNLSGTSTEAIQLENMKVESHSIVNTNNYEIQLEGELNLNGEGTRVNVGTKDFILNGTLIGDGLFAVNNSGTVIRTVAINEPNDFPISDGTNDFSFTITPSNNPSNPIEVRLVSSSEAPEGTGMLSNMLFDIEGDPSLDATIVFTIPDASLVGGKLPENVVFRFWNGTRYQAISAENITIVDNGTSYTVTITNVNQF